MPLSDLIKPYMTNVISNYNSIRGKKKNEDKYTFWDAVAISALDKIQKNAYEMQISEKQKRFELPLDVPFHVFYDPPGYKIGCGGSAMFVLEKLFLIYEDTFHKMRILFIPAGGYSQRLPNWSVLGKLFCPVPLDAPKMYQMIDLILATYLPFLKKMKPGVFLASSDALISYHMDHNDNWCFFRDGFTALAHPSSISIGLNHGVFVLPQQCNKSYTTNSFMCNCIRVLQKPSEKMMRENKAVQIFEGEPEKSEIVYSDSAFFFDSNVALKLVKFYQSIKPLDCEISSYGDFLHSLGTNIDVSYAHCDVGSKESDVKSRLYQLLQGTPLNILVLNNSDFHHFGTMWEYVTNYRFNSKFSLHLPHSKSVFSVCPVSLTDAYCTGTLLHSYVHQDSQLSPSSVLEYCDFNVPVEIGDNCIISNCSINSEINIQIVIPSNILIHTASVDGGFVTICFNLSDEIKKSCYHKDAGNLVFLGCNLRSLMNVRTEIFNEDLEQVSLWDAKIFQLCKNRDVSFIQTIKLIRLILFGEENMFDSNITAYVSVKDVLNNKNISSILSYQKKLCSKIMSAEIM